MDLQAQFFKPINPRSPQIPRTKQPSPEKRATSSNVLISPKKRTASNELQESPLKKRVEVSPQNAKAKTIDLSTQMPFNQLNLEVQNSSNIVFERSLFDSKSGRYRTFKSDEVDIIKKLFPSAASIYIYPPYLVVVVRELPAKPWPLTIAGLPLFLVSTTGQKPHHGASGLGGVHLDDQDFRGQPSMLVLNKATQYLISQQKLPISSITYYGIGGVLKIVLAKEFDRSKVPGTLGRVLCYYKLKADEKPPIDTAFRRLNPTPEIVDDTDYLSGGSTLRPGVVVSDNISGRWEGQTTSGVSVCHMNNATQRYITTASHGFKYENKDVWHPRAGDRGARKIASYHGQLDVSDINLAKLEPGIKYENVTFDNEQHSAITITHIINGDDIPMGDDLYFNSPFTGHCKSIWIGTRWDFEVPGIPNPDTGPEGAIRYVGHTVIHVGNGLQDPVAGTCGAPIVTEDGGVVGFFRYLADDGEAYCPLASLLTEMGYRLCNA